MATALLERPSAKTPNIGFPESEGRMYAIAFDMEIDALRTHYGEPYNGVYAEIRRVLESHGFRWQQGSTYFDGEEVNAVTCVMAAMDLGRKLSWFSACVRDIRMMRIEELNDLMPAVERAAGEE